MRLATWQSLAVGDRTTTTATVDAGSREVRIAPTGMPIQTPEIWFPDTLVQAWEALTYAE